MNNIIRCWPDVGSGSLKNDAHAAAYRALLKVFFFFRNAAYRALKLENMTYLMLLADTLTLKRQAMIAP